MILLTAELFLFFVTMVNFQVSQTLILTENFFFDRRFLTLLFRTLSTLF